MTRGGIRRCGIMNSKGRTLSMLVVTNLIIEAQRDAALRQQLVDSPATVARERCLPDQVTQSAAIVLRGRGESNPGIWF
jgi:hypothetical protein